MEYVVIRSFTDKNSQEHYAVGDRYPRRGFASKSRVAELSTTNNKRGVELIAEKEAKEKIDVEDLVSKETKITKSEINAMTVSEVRELAKLNDIEDADELSGNKLKKLLIEKMGL